MNIFIIRDKTEFKLGYIQTVADEQTIETMKEDGGIIFTRQYGINELVEDLMSRGYETERIYPDDIYLIK